MNTELEFFKEPNLVFGNDYRTEDPRDGLTLFGPQEGLHLGSHMRAGVIGTANGINLYKQFVEVLKKPMISDDISRPSFPGFEAVYGIQWPSEPVITRVIDEQKLNEALKIPGVKERTYRLVNLYLEEILKVNQEEETNIEIWFIIVPKLIWLKCRPLGPNLGLQLDTKDLKKYMAGQRSLLDDINRQFEESVVILNSDSDFHDQLKARLLKEKIRIPVQLLLEPTLKFRDKYRNFPYEAEMQAHVAWTQSTTAYYKLGRLPWKLGDIRKGVCYVGLVFKKYERIDRKGFACSAAQMFLDSGDGTVFKGNVGPWESKSSKEYHLDREAAKDLLSLAIQSYLDKRKEPPQELFIHGRAGFAPDEWQGFKDAIAELSPTTNLVGIVIKETDKIKLFRGTEEKVKKYGNLRGLALIIDDFDSFLWTRGFIPRLDTSSSIEIPNPLRVTINKGKADIRQVLKDIMALTKLNYNACIYGDGLPVTLRFSDLIGNILTAVDGIEGRVLPFKFYI